MLRLQRTMSFPGHRKKVSESLIIEMGMDRKVSTIPVFDSADPGIIKLKPGKTHV